MKRWFVAIFIFMLSSYCFASTVEYYGANIPTRFYDEFINLCVEYEINSQYAARLIQWESGWNEYCVTTNKNGTKDIGITKLNSAYISDFEFRYNKGKKINALFWKENMRIGLKHFSVLKKETGSWFGAVCAYNMGLNAYNSWKDSKRALPIATFREIEFIFN